MISATTSLSNVNGALALYQQLSGKTSEEVLAKQGGKFASILARALRQRSPAKGSIRSEALALLKSGRGIKIRDTVRQQVEGKWTKTWAKAQSKLERQYWGESVNEGFGKAQEMVRREIAVRESGRGFLSVSARYPTTVAQGMKAISRYSQAVSRVGIKLAKDNNSVSFVWDGTSRQGRAAARGLGGQAAQEAIVAAADALTADIGTYTARKQQELALKVLRLAQRNGGRA